MRKLLSLLLALSLLAALWGCSSSRETQEEALPESIEFNFFYNEPCGSCQDQINDFYNLFNEALEGVKDLYPYDLNVYNVFKQSESQTMNSALEQLGYSQEIIRTLTFPILTLNGKVYLGTDSIKESLREAYLTAGEDLFICGRGVYNPLEEKTLAQQLEDYHPGEGELHGGLFLPAHLPGVR